MCNIENSCNCGAVLVTIYTQFTGKCVECERFEESTGLSAKMFRTRQNVAFPEIETCEFVERICGQTTV